MAWEPGNCNRNLLRRHRSTTSATRHQRCWSWLHHTCGWIECRQNGCPFMWHMPSDPHFHHVSWGLNCNCNKNPKVSRTHARQPGAASLLEDRRFWENFLLFNSNALGPLTRTNLRLASRSTFSIKGANQFCTTIGVDRRIASVR